jgi:nucleoside-diphosphate-sugar epimerase
VSFPVADAFASVMELLHRVTPGEPLITRSIVHLLRETGATNTRAHERLGYTPKVPWHDAIRVQMEDMQPRPM